MLKDNILKFFIEEKKSVTLQELSDLFDVSRNACWKAINKLVEEGFEITSSKKDGYTYFENDKLNCIEINLYSKYFNCVEAFDSIDSTSTYLKKQPNLDSYCVVVSNEQTAGRGRRGKTFTSKKGKGAYFTLYMKENVSTDDIGFVTICVAVAIRRCLSIEYGIDASIKWLNDIYYDEKKLCGILTEATISAEEACINELYIGIGINTLTVDKFISEYATSVEQISGLVVNRNQLIANILNYFKIVFDECFKNSGKQSILEEYISHQFIIGRKYKMDLDNKIIDVVVKGINDRAELIVEVDGRRLELNRGTLLLRGEDNERK